MTSKGRIAVTGASGFVGRNLIPHLCAAGWDVVALTRNSKKISQAADLPIEVRETDWNSPVSLRRGLEGVQVLIHCAAIHPLRGIGDAKSIIAFNVETTRLLLESAPPLKKVVVLSSMRSLLNHSLKNHIYNGIETYDFDRFDMPYGLSKHLMERVCIDWSKKTGTPVIFANPTAIVGANDTEPSPNGRFILATIKSKVVFSLDTTFSWVGVQDVARALVLLAETGISGTKYLICSANWPYGKFLSKILEASGKRNTIIRLPFFLLNMAAHVFDLIHYLIPGIYLPITRASMHYARLNPSFDGSLIEQLGFRYDNPERTLADTVGWLIRNQISVNPAIPGKGIDNAL